jgi:uncharacterized protein (TIGR03435 family)
MRLPGLLVIAVLTPAGLVAQPAFDVASIKPSGTDGRVLDFRVYPGGRLHITNLTLEVIIREAYGIKPYQLSGGPAWLRNHLFDIEAKAPGDPVRPQMMGMLQTLLADRFQLKVHRESREENIYALVVAKGGPKLTPSTAADSYVRLYRNTAPELPGVDYTIGGQKVNMRTMAERIGELAVHRPVTDRTGFAGEFDFKLRYATDDNPRTGPSIFAAIQEQLGLKLEAAKGLVEILLIDKAEKPSGN